MRVFWAYYSRMIRVPLESFAIDNASLRKVGWVNINQFLWVC